LLVLSLKRTTTVGQWLGPISVRHTIVVRSAPTLRGRGRA